METDSGANLSMHSENPASTEQLNSSPPIKFSSDGGVSIPPPPLPPPAILKSSNQVPTPRIPQPAPMQNVGQAFPFSNPYMPQNYGYGNNMYYPGQYNSMLSKKDSRFMRLAEESTRPTFQAMESVVRAAHSISFLTESVFDSLNISFRAVLTVVESVSSLKYLVKTLVASLLALRVVRKFLWGVLTLLRSLGLISTSSEQLTKLLDLSGVKNNGTSSSLANPNVASQGSSWPFMAFVAFIIAAPYLLTKVLSIPDDNNGNSDIQQQPPSQNQQKSKIFARAIYDFTGRTKSELSVIKGEPLEILGLHEEWLLVKNDKNGRGLVPRNYMDLERHN